MLNAVRGKRESVSVFFLTLQTALSVWVQSTRAVGFAMDKGDAGTLKMMPPLHGHSWSGGHQHQGEHLNKKGK